MVKQINDNIFEEEVLDSEKLTIVDFWASWCGPCRMLSPVIEELSKELEGKAKFVKVNVDENPLSSNQYRVASIPTVMIFKKGEVVDTLVGFRPKQLMKDTIERYI